MLNFPLLPAITLALAAPPPLPAPLGSAHPLFVQAAAPDGSWVVACQARSDTDGNGTVSVSQGMHGDLYGDALSPYLLTPATPLGEEIDAFVAKDPTGRWIVVQRSGALELRDTLKGAVVGLGQPAADDGNPTLRSRAAAFSGAGELLYLAGDATQEVVRLRTLATGEERILETGPGRIWRAEWESSGWVAVGVITADTNGDGVIGLPSAPTTLAGGACRGSPMSYSTYGIKGDAVEWRVYRASDGVIEPRPILGEGAAGVLVRAADATITWVPTTGEERAIAPATCAGPVLGVLGDARAVLVLCGEPAAPFVYDADGAHPMDFPIDDSERSYARRGRFIPVGGYQLADLERHTLIPRAYAGVHGTFGDHVLQIDKDYAVRWVDTVTGAKRVLLQRQTTANGSTQFGRWVALRSREVRLIDIREGVVAGRLSGVPTVVRDDGASLVPAAPNIGPLQWEWAAP